MGKKTSTLSLRRLDITDRIDWNLGAVQLSSTLREEALSLECNVLADILISLPRLSKAKQIAMLFFTLPHVFISLLHSCPRNVTSPQPSYLWKPLMSLEHKIELAWSASPIQVKFASSTSLACIPLLEDLS